MARARKQKPWEAMFCRIEAIYRSEWLYPPKPSAADLDAVGAELGINFPASYRAFAQEFGLGGTLHVLPDVLPLTSPTRAGDGDVWSSVREATRFLRGFLREHPEYPENTGPPGLTERMVVFAVDGGYHTFVFDPGAITDARWQECRIYDLGRSGPVAHLTDSFGEWLRYIDLSYRFDEEEVAEEEEGEPEYPVVRKPISAHPAPMPYSRDSLREKNAPEAPDVQAWLAWNNGTIRALALSIRQGRPDAFGVLADALEEAGCDNEDLLYSCRAGDPDIDGPWALAVLLGKERPNT
jgi:hypothetical protein